MNSLTSVFYNYIYYIPCLHVFPILHNMHLLTPFASFPKHIKLSYFVLFTTFYIPMT